MLEMAVLNRRGRRHRPLSSIVAVCTENLNPHIVVMKSAKDCV
jgi:hypothetical protein